MGLFFGTEEVILIQIISMYETSAKVDGRRVNFSHQWKMKGRRENGYFQIKSKKTKHGRMKVEAVKYYCWTE